MNSFETDISSPGISPGFSLVTVVFEAEFELLCLQARSIALYCSPDVIAEIFVLDNFEIGMTSRQRSLLLSSYGTMKERVRILKRDEFSFIPSKNGYITQQLLKLFVADVIAMESYVVLDAKSHFIRTLELSFLQAPDGRPRIRVYPYTSHPLRKQLVAALELFDLDQDKCLEAFTPTVPPFTIVTSIARDLVHSDSLKTGQSFTDIFLAQGLTEFFCYSAYLLSTRGSFQSVYCCDQPECQILWGGNASRQTFLDAVAMSDRDQTPVLAIHRRALESFGPSALWTTAHWWVARGLFTSHTQAIALMVKTGLHSRWTRWAARLRKAASNARDLCRSRGRG